MIEICYGTCLGNHEDRDGECRKPASMKCPDEWETPEEYWEYVENRADDEGERKWEMGL